MLAINDKTAVVRKVLLICAITKSLYIGLYSIKLNFIKKLSLTPIIFNSYNI